MGLTGLQRRILELLDGGEPSASTGTLLAKLDVSPEALGLAVKPLAEKAYVVAWVASLSGGWEITPRGRDAPQD